MILKMSEIILITIKKHIQVVSLSDHQNFFRSLKLPEIRTRQFNSYRYVNANRIDLISLESVKMKPNADLISVESLYYPTCGMKSGKALKYNC